MFSSLDDAHGTVRRENPDVVILTGECTSLTPSSSGSGHPLREQGSASRQNLPWRISFLRRDGGEGSLYGTGTWSPAELLRQRDRAGGVEALDG